MPRPEKVAFVDEVAEELRASPATLVTDYRGLSVADLAELRSALRDVGARYRVVKNTLTRRACDQAGLDGLTAFLTGPTALTFCGDDPVAPAKALRSFSRDHPELVVKGGWVEGEILDAEATLALAELATREELLTELAQMFNSGPTSLVRLLAASLTDMAGLFQALEDKRREQGGDEVEDAAPDEEPATDAAESAAAGSSDEQAADADAAPVADEAEQEEPAAAGADGDEPAADEPVVDEAEQEEPAAAGADGDEPAATDADAEPATRDEDDR